MPTNKKHIFLSYLMWVFILLGVILIISTYWQFGLNFYLERTISNNIGLYLLIAFSAWLSWGIYLYLKNNNYPIFSSENRSSSTSDYKKMLITSLVANDLKNPKLKTISEEKLRDIQNYFEKYNHKPTLKLTDEISFIENYLETFRNDEQYFILFKEVDSRYDEMSITNMIIYPIINHFCHSSNNDLEIHLSINKGLLNLTITSENEINPPKHSIVQDIIMYQRFYSEEQILVHSSEKAYTIGVPLIT